MTVLIPAVNCWATVDRLLKQTPKCKIALAVRVPRERFEASCGFAARYADGLRPSGKIV